MNVRKLAVLAGVSPATVSRCLHSPHLVSPTTLERVQAVIQQHRYIYNATATTFARQRSNVVAVTLPTPVIPVFAQTLVGVQESAFERNIPLFIGSTDYSPKTERGVLQQCLEHRVSGVILFGFDHSNIDKVKELQESGIPCLVVWEKFEDFPIHYVGIDNYLGVRHSLEYLVSLGHKRIAAVFGPQETHNRTKHRLAAYRDVLAEHNLPFEPELVLIGPPSLAYGRESVKHFLGCPKAPTAILAGSDFLAIAALAELREQGIRVPEDMSICGFDDFEISAHLIPQLTSTKVFCMEMGRVAMQYMAELQNADKPHALYKRLLPTEFIIRQSCAPPRHSLSL